MKINKSIIFILCSIRIASLSFSVDVAYFSPKWVKLVEEVINKKKLNLP